MTNNDTRIATFLKVIVLWALISCFIMFAFPIIVDAISNKASMSSGIFFKLIGMGALIFPLIGASKDLLLQNLISVNISGETIAITVNKSKPPLVYEKMISASCQKNSFGLYRTYYFIFMDDSGKKIELSVTDKHSDFPILLKLANECELQITEKNDSSSYTSGLDG